MGKLADARAKAAQRTLGKIMKQPNTTDAVLKASDMDVMGGVFGIRFTKGCFNGCAELYIEDDDNYHYKFTCDRQWLSELADVAQRAAAHK